MSRPPKAEESLTVAQSIRTTQRQQARLARISAADGLGQQEHIRRALDIYLGAMEKNYSLPPIPVIIPSNKG